MYTNRVFGTAKCVLFIEVSSFQGVLIREIPLYIIMHIENQNLKNLLVLCVEVVCIFLNYVFCRCES